ncbi:MAG: response regulator [Planctomycetaceae bacterium]|nr:response regulator [Planctomycetaceae bacterium]
MRKLQALIVDDDPFMVRLIETVITRKFADRIQLETSSDPVAALKLLETRRYDLLFTDLEMPVIDGMQILAAARQRNAWTRVVVITGHSTLDRVNTALELGACDYIMKPLNPGVLQEVVEQHITQQSRWQQAARETLQAANA